jgi:hypothetical protein
VTWLDLPIVFALASTVALAARRRLAGAVIGLGAVPLWLALSLPAPPYRLGLALVAAAGLAAAAQVAGRREALSPRLATLLGGLGGLALAALFALALATALPLEPSLTQAGRYHYPPLTFPTALRDSALVGLGRAILEVGSEGPYSLFFPDRPRTAAP